ncbi:Guanine nucleotide exchange factor LTE1 [Neolecta irregularis DAH-3]|uniref:Guanine nucleotide exchange factor LTE1 n=1 Tax=Neolecta irregularis (strain DAH-3) TaxID=1198029 RepID=A0A1U7LLT0_NEOID|nr:Guanine nucleotide exchange factor LTE1 [Neolecta irregularis DAH-3]|eukprot:OLL23620.1 Guanine nucleotide exchange factor LTE1 [Neolecta irregularis DAH-3]
MPDSDPQSSVPSPTTPSSTGFSARTVRRSLSISSSGKAFTIGVRYGNLYLKPSPTATDTILKLQPPRNSFYDSPSPNRTFDTFCSDYHGTGTLKPILTADGRRKNEECVPTFLSTSEEAVLPFNTPPDRFASPSRNISSNPSILSVFPGLNTPCRSTMDTGADPLASIRAIRNIDTPVRSQTPSWMLEPISPELFDVLSFPPASVDPSVVQFDARSGILTAATPPRLVTAITSAESLDYDLMGDFFLTYRLFLSPTLLLRLLEARIIWALSRDDDIGRIVRIRTFVALRHWILNYFADDFVSSISLRNMFAKFLNELANEDCIAYSLRDQRIVSELKRCWVRACEIYWEIPSNRASCDITPDIRVNAGGPLPGRKELVTRTYSQNLSAAIIRRHSKSKSDDWTEKKYCTPRKTYSRISPFTSSSTRHRASSIAESIHSNATPSPVITRYLPLPQTSLVRGGGKLPTPLFGWTGSNFEETPKKTNGMRKMFLTMKKRLKAMQGEELPRPVSALRCVGDIPLQGRSSLAGKGFRIDLLGAGTTELWDDTPPCNVADTLVVEPPEDFMDPEILKIVQAQRSPTPLDSPSATAQKVVSVDPIASSPNVSDLPESSPRSCIPKRNLRRKPGGDLKIAHTVSDLLPERPRSGSTFSTANHGSVISPQFGRFSHTPSVDVPCESSTPAASLNLGVTLENGMLALTDIPSDDDSDNGGVSTALLKLEGRYHRKTKICSEHKIRDSGLGSDNIPKSLSNSNSIASPLVDGIKDYSQRKQRHRQVVKVMGGEREALTIPDVMIEEVLDEEAGPSRDFEKEIEQLAIADFCSPDSAQLQRILTSETTNIQSMLPQHKFPHRKVATSLSIHLPFILAYDSLILARQLTLIERDAIIEVDWQELAHMTWIGNADIIVRDWVSIVSNTKITGISLVIARFNLMCSWVASEIAMTQKLEERIKVVEKFIHLAMHSYRLSNFATFIQILLALQSPHVAKLRRTWRGVSNADLKVLRELETVASPLRNWRNLRMVMEVDDPDQKECIPFIGIYLSDLIFNAQRPDRVPTLSMPQEMLVNFDRHRTTAGIIKKVLGMIEKARGYSFESIEEPFQRCLWLAALDESGLQRCADQIE